MNVIFISKSTGSALKSVRTILDSYADRIGDDAWRTVITEDGLEKVKSLLKKNAKRNTAVACFRVTTRHSLPLYWVVGRRDVWNQDGCIAVKHSSKSYVESDYMKNLTFLKPLKAVSGLAALLHDIGKCNDAFQDMLRDSRKGDYFRHEWISALIIASVCRQAKEAGTDWLDFLISGNFDEKLAAEVIQNDKHLINADIPFSAKIVIWIVLSHHRMPLERNDKRKFFDSFSFDSFFDDVSSEWSYEKSDNSKRNRNITFSGNILFLSEAYYAELVKYAKLLKEVLPRIEEMRDCGGLRLFLVLARNVIMIGDYYASSLGKSESFMPGTDLLAKSEDLKRNQKAVSLDEHLLAVLTKSREMLAQLAWLRRDADYAYDIHFPKSSGKKFSWQDKAVKAFNNIRDADDNDEKGFFIINMAGTGTGKTIGNAKIMSAISSDGGVRYTVAMGLRSLTLQTGEAYSSQMGIDRDDVATVIGSSAYAEIYSNDSDPNKDIENFYVVSGHGEDIIRKSCMSVVFKKDSSLKDKKFFLKPIVITTIDHLTGISETLKGSRHLLPFFRLFSGDLIIDEIDDFSQSDFPAILRLVFNAGMMGVNVIVSSATISPEISKALFFAYNSGRCEYASLIGIRNIVYNAVCDEFNVSYACTNDWEVFSEIYNEFISKKIGNLKKSPVKRMGRIVPFYIHNDLSFKENRALYFKAVLDEIPVFHKKNCGKDPYSGKNVSFGCIRVAHIDTCVLLSRFIEENGYTGCADIYCLCYHSNDTLLIRSRKEKYLDIALYRKNEKLVYDDAVIRKHIDSSSADNVIFVVVCTPVEETGRDHDFDWAIMEPSSWKSVIQMSGRVLRHRSRIPSECNIGLMEYNLNSLKDDTKAVFVRPGYEGDDIRSSKKLDSHSLLRIVNEKKYLVKIDARGRIKCPDSNSRNDFIKLEHNVMNLLVKKTAYPKNISGYVNEAWFLTGYPAYYSPFRKGSSSRKVRVRECDDEFFFEVMDGNEWKNVSSGFSVRKEYGNHWWLPISYSEIVKEYVDSDDETEKVYNKFGIADIGFYDSAKTYSYSDQTGFSEF